MIRTYGTMPLKSDLFSRKIIFPQLAELDTWTGDDRLLESEGGGVRTLPRTIKIQYSDDMGHYGSEPFGALHVVTIDPEAKIMFGEGWIMAGPEGDKAIRHIASKALHHNSVDLAEVTVEIEWDDDDFWDYKLRFTEWNLGATTLVAMPAFANARAVLDNADLAAALTSDEPLTVHFEAPTKYNFVHATPDLKANAAAAIVQPWDDFHMPEAAEPHKVTVDAEGRVFGNPCKWDSCWGDEDPAIAACIIPPRPMDNYAAFMQPGVLTDRGMVDTAPLFLVNGHPEIGPTEEDFNKAYGGAENAVADIRVTPGVHGPWVSGRVRPGATPEQIYAARASRFSGHWRRGDLRAIVAVNVAGFDVGGSGRDLTASFTLDEDGQVVDLIAGMPCAENAEEVEVTEETVPDAVLAVAAENRELELLELEMELEDS